MLQGRKLRWLDGILPLGYGAALSAKPLPAGRNHIRLVARDAVGHTASAMITVIVSPVNLPFLTLKIPHTVSHSTRGLTVGASSAVPATLTIDGHRFHLTRKLNQFRLAIRPARAPLLLELSVTANGSTIPFAQTVNRIG